METIQTQTLSQAAQAARDKAREILRTAQINRLMQDKFNVNQDVEIAKENLKNEEKELARSNYRLSKLDNADPDYADKLKDETECNKYKTKIVETCKAQVTRQETLAAENTAELDEKITKWESGESKVSIDAVNDLADQIIRKI